MSVVPVSALIMPAVHPGAPCRLGWDEGSALNVAGRKQAFIQSRKKWFKVTDECSEGRRGVDVEEQEGGRAISGTMKV